MSPPPPHAPQQNHRGSKAEAPGIIHTLLTPIPLLLRTPRAENTQACSHSIDSGGIQFVALDADDGADVFEVTGGAALDKGMELTGDCAFG